MPSLDSEHYAVLILIRNGSNVTKRFLGLLCMIYHNDPRSIPEVILDLQIVALGASISSIFEHRIATSA